MEQLGNIGSEVGRALRARDSGNPDRAAAARDRGLELFDLTLADERWAGRRREIARARERFVGQFLRDDRSEVGSLEPYFLQFAVAARRSSAVATPVRSTLVNVVEIDVARVRRFCADRVPRNIADSIRLDVEVTGRRITIIERRAPWTPEIGPEWTSVPIAQLRGNATDGSWTLFWSDSNNVWHRDPIEPTPQIDRLLARITADSSNRYWG